MRRLIDGFARWRGYVNWSNLVVCVMGRRGWVPLTEFRKLQDSYMAMGANYWSLRRVVENNRYWPDIPPVISTDYDKGIPCS